MSPRPDAHIPGPTGPEMVRNIRLMRRDPPAFLATCAERYGPVVAFPLPRATAVYLADPVDVRHVLQGNHRAYGKRTVQYDALALVTGQGLLASDGELWRRMRRVQQPAFHSQLIEHLGEQVQVPVAGMVERWSHLPSGTVLDIDQEMLHLTLEIVGSTLFGADLGRDASSLVDTVMSALNVVVARSQQPFTSPDWLPSPSGNRLRRSMVHVDAAVERLVRARRRAPLGSDVLSLLLMAQDEGRASSTEVRNEVVTLIVAGHETVAATLTWTWSLLASDCDVQRRLHEEVDALSPESLGAGSVARLTYTRAVIDECLRLYPPAWVISRRSRMPDVVGGYEIPSGTTVIASPYALQRDLRVWEAPDRFDPSRFLGPQRAVDRAGYLPFGVGPRLCIGRDLALFEAPLIIAALARRFQVRPTEPQRVTKQFGVTLRPRHGLPGAILARKSRSPTAGAVD